ncbi:MAG: hypothetical protein LBQ54_15745 [Planctomycetaceae bacterium]|nr:hypothetical protein [Planctomycetaceae bacterium]
MNRSEGVGSQPRAAADGGSYRSESHEPARVAHWNLPAEQCLQRKQTERVSIESEPNEVSVSKPGSNVRMLAVVVSRNTSG